MSEKRKWTLGDDDFVRAENLQPLWSDKPVLCVAEDLNQKAYVRYKMYDEVDNNALSLHEESGLTCKILKLGTKTWVSGKLRYVLEFEPDDPDVMSAVEEELQERDSPKPSGNADSLDEIRQLGDE